LKAQEESGRRRSARIAARKKNPMSQSFGKDSHWLHLSPSESNYAPSLSSMIGKCRIQSSKEGDVLLSYFSFLSPKPDYRASIGCNF